MKAYFLTPVVLVCVSLNALAADLPKPLATGMKNPESVCLGSDNRIYVTEIGEFNKDGDGRVVVVVDGQVKPFASGLDDPKGIIAYQSALYVADKTRVIKVDAQGQVSTFVAADKFPKTPLFLNDIAIEPESGTLYVSDSGNLQGADGAVFSIDVKTGKTGIVLDSKTLPELNTPNGLLLDGASHLMMVDFGSGALYRITLADKSAKKVNDGFDGGDGLTWDKQKRLLVTSWKTGKVFAIPALGQAPVLLTDKFEQAADCCLDSTGRFLLIPDMKAGTLTALPIAAAN